MPLIVTLLLLEHTKAPPDEYSAKLLLKCTEEFSSMMTLLSENAAVPLLSALLLVNVMKECPTSKILPLCNVQIAPAKDYSHSLDVHDTVLALRATWVLALNVIVEDNADVTVLQI